MYIGSVGIPPLVASYDRMPETEYFKRLAKHLLIHPQAGRQDIANILVSPEATWSVCHKPNSHRALITSILALVEL